MKKIYIIEIRQKKTGRIQPAAGFFTSYQSAMEVLNGHYLEALLEDGLYEAEIRPLFNFDEPPF